MRQAKINHLHMSAKCSTFAAEMIETMNIEEMTHTAWRCRHSHYFTLKEGMRCVRLHKPCIEAVCKDCKLWQPTEQAEAYFNNDIHGSLYKAMSNIYLERVLKGTF